MLQALERPRFIESSPVTYLKDIVLLPVAEIAYFEADQERERQVGVQGPLVDLVEHHRRHARELGVALDPAQQHPGGHELDSRRGAAATPSSRAMATACSASSRGASTRTCAPNPRRR